MSVLSFVFIFIWLLLSSSDVFVSAGIQTDSVLSARLQIIRIFIREDGRLVIEFKTHAKFRGQLIKHRTGRMFNRFRRKQQKTGPKMYISLRLHLQVSLSPNTTPCRVTSPGWWRRTTWEAWSSSCSCCGAHRPLTRRINCGGPPAPTAGQQIHAEPSWTQHSGFCETYWTGSPLVGKIVSVGCIRSSLVLKGARICPFDVCSEVDCRIFGVWPLQHAFGFYLVVNIRSSTGRTTLVSTWCFWSPARCSPPSPGWTPGTNLCPAQLTLQRGTGHSCIEPQDQGTRICNGSLESWSALRQVSGADRLPADQQTRSCRLLPEHGVPAVQQREGLPAGPGQRWRLHGWDGLQGSLLHG